MHPRRAKHTIQWRVYWVPDMGGPWWLSQSKPMPRNTRFRSHRYRNQANAGSKTCSERQCTCGYVDAKSRSQSKICTAWRKCSTAYMDVSTYDQCLQNIEYSHPRRKHTLAKQWLPLKNLGSWNASWSLKMTKSRILAKTKKCKSPLSISN